MVQYSPRCAGELSNHCKNFVKELSATAAPHAGANGKAQRCTPNESVAYILMVQRSNFPNSDASDVRREFQKAAAIVLAIGKAKP